MSAEALGARGAAGPAAGSTGAAPIEPAYYCALCGGHHPFSAAGCPVQIAAGMAPIKRTPVIVDVGNPPTGAGAGKGTGGASQMTDALVPKLESGTAERQDTASSPVGNAAHTAGDGAVAALGGSNPPQSTPIGSCLVCGQLKPFAVWHYTEVAGVCFECRDLRAALAAAEREKELEVRRGDWIEVHDKLDELRRENALLERQRREACKEVEILFAEASERAKLRAVVHAVANLTLPDLLAAVETWDALIVHAQRALSPTPTEPPK